jgi:hypothetical protein
MQKIACGLCFVSVLVAGVGCDNRLTPDRVRELLDDPQGDVTPSSMTRVTRDLFRGSGAAAGESFAQLFKIGQSDGGGPSNALPVSTGVMEDVGDAFCVGSLVLDIAAFDDCDLGGDCKEELVLDSCLLRVGEGDEAARGKFVFKIDSSVTDDVSTSKLGIEMDGWESSRDSTTLDTFSGRVDLETIADDGDNSLEVVFASDFDTSIKRKERGFFDDGIEERVQMAAGMRFTAQRDADSARGALEVLTFVDEGGDRTQSVAVSFEAEGHQFSAEEATASASLSVTGNNGSFVCTWSAASRDADRDGLLVQSAGECTDDAGNTFSFEGTATDHD